MHTERCRSLPTNVPRGKAEPQHSTLDLLEPVGMKRPTSNHALDDGLKNGPPYLELDPEFSKPGHVPRCAHDCFKVASHRRPTVIGDLTSVVSALVGPPSSLQYLVRQVHVTPEAIEAVLPPRRLFIESKLILRFRLGLGLVGDTRLGWWRGGMLEARRRKQPPATLFGI